MCEKNNASTDQSEKNTETSNIGTVCSSVGAQSFDLDALRDLDLELSDYLSEINKTNFVI